LSSANPNPQKPKPSIEPNGREGKEREEGGREEKKLAKTAVGHGRGQILLFFRDCLFPGLLIIIGPFADSLFHLPSSIFFILFGK
jgi:hypothetical protein